MTETTQRLADLRDKLINEHSQAPGLFGEIARMENLLADTYRNRVAYELLQNSEDAGSTSVVISRVIHGTWRWTNNGRPLNSADLEALCRSASSTKLRGGDSIGYRGIGFKSLAAISSRIEIRSADVAFAFDRESAAQMLSTFAQDVPLIRIPCEIQNTEFLNGTSFTIVPRKGSGVSSVAVDPLSVLFLRNVDHLEINGFGDAFTINARRDSTGVTLTDPEGPARFELVHHGHATVAIPLDARAQSFVGLGGRLACGLPLDDQLGLPVVVSGDLLTDPSRTHAVIGDESTQRVLDDAATAMAEVLSKPTSPQFQRLWQLLLEGEDLRSSMVSSHATASKVILVALQRAMKLRVKPFSYSPLALTAEDVSRVFPSGAPLALYTQKNKPSARALKAVLGLETLDLTTLVDTPTVDELSDELMTNLSEHLRELARTFGRQLTPAEQLIADQTAPEPRRQPESATHFRAEETRAGQSQVAESLAEIVTRWRTAEVATMEYLNGRGWRLRDVSGQNVGYDLDGTDPSGKAVHIEVKKVDHPNARFAMTNNEMSLMLADPGAYLLAVLVGDGRHVKLMILNPASDKLPKERVCRRWDWEFTDWVRFASVIE